MVHDDCAHSVVCLHFSVAVLLGMCVHHHAGMEEKKVVVKN